MALTPAQRRQVASQAKGGMSAATQDKARAAARAKQREQAAAQHVRNVHDQAARKARVAAATGRSPGTSQATLAAAKGTGIIGVKGGSAPAPRSVPGARRISGGASVGGGGGGGGNRTYKRKSNGQFNGS